MEKESSRLARERWEKIFEEWVHSGLGLYEYCKRKKIHIGSFYRWRKKLNFPCFKKPQRIIQNWDEIIEDWERSGLSVRKYCAEKNIPTTGLYKRRCKISHPSYMSVQDTTNKWRAIVKDWETSGLTSNGYARKNGLSLSALLHWDKKLNPHAIRKTIHERAVERWTKIMEDWQKSVLSGFTYCQRK